MWQYDSIQFREFNPIMLMWTQHRINTEKLYFLTREKKTTQEEEDTNLEIKNIGELSCLTSFLKSWNRLHLFFRKLLQVKKLYEIFSFAGK